jgi:5-oxoprolinase (ATP-hydrolysing) subunit A
VLLNLDAGEYASEPDELWALADILCIACGGHAGDTDSMTRVVTFCVDRQRGPRLGAHPSYPDRAGFGRVSRAPRTADERRSLAASLVEQCAALAAIARARGGAVEYIKPHGALYHDANGDAELARTVVEAARTALGADVRVIGPPTGCLRDAAGDACYLRETFADRRARPDGTLVPRSDPDALIMDPALAAARARELLAANAADTVCCHADTPGALAIVAAVRAALS